MSKKIEDIAVTSEFWEKESWLPSLRLRWFRDVNGTKTLQQQHFSNKGNRRWVDVEIVDYTDEQPEPKIKYKSPNE